MSYADYLRTQQINRPRIFDRQQKYGDTSNFIQRTKLANSWIQGSTNHVINNSFNPFIPNPSTSKMPMKFVGSGAGGRVPDASLFTLSRAARSIKEDVNRFSSVKTVQEYCVRATPAASIIVNNGLNYNGLPGGDWTGSDYSGLNSGYTEPCTLFRPQTASHLVVRNPALDRLGVQPREAWSGLADTHYGSQNPLSPTCTSTLTTANHLVKVIPHGNAYSRPPGTDFPTSRTGPQVSPNGAFGRPGKLGGVLARSKLVEKHRGNPRIGHLSKYTVTDLTTNKPETYRIPKNA